MAKNERNNEDLVKEALRNLGYYEDASEPKVESQKSVSLPVKNLLRAASKSGGGGIGFPEFLISSDQDRDFIVVVECKASHNDHVSKDFENILKGDPKIETSDQKIKRVKRFAADGAIHYAESLSKSLTLSRSRRAEKPRERFRFQPTYSARVRSFRRFLPIGQESQLQRLSLGQTT